MDTFKLSVMVTSAACAGGMIEPRPEFSKLVLMTIVIALPVGWLVTRHLLNYFAYRIDLQWW